MYSRLLLAMSIAVIAEALIAAEDYAALSSQQRDKIAQQTEVWDPEPAEVSFTSHNVPSDALVLFDGSNLDAWEGNNGKKPGWLLSNGIMTVTPKSGSLHSKEHFCDAQFHIEWRAPTEKTGQGHQQWGNSGVFFQSRYELQIHNSYRNRTYANGQAASIYKQHAPLVNATTAAGTWQSYDIVFTAPRFDRKGKVVSPAYITAFHNGVLVQNHSELQGPTVYIGKPEYRAHGCAPLMLQDHSSRVSFRNIWARKL